MWCSESPSAIRLEWRIIPPDTRYRLRVVDRKPCDFSKWGLSPTMEQTLLTDHDEFGPESVPPPLMKRGGGRPPSQKAGDGRHRSVCQGSELQGPSQGMNNTMSSFRSLPPLSDRREQHSPGVGLDASSATRIMETQEGKIWYAFPSFRSVPCTIPSKLNGGLWFR